MMCSFPYVELTKPVPVSEGDTLCSNYFTTRKNAMLERNQL